MWFLHTGFRGLSPRLPQRAPESVRRRDPRGAVGEPVPVHRVSGHHRRGETRSEQWEFVMTAGRFMGQAIARSEDPRLLTGRGRCIAAVAVPGASDAAFLRSEVARGRIVSLDVEAARSAPGVRAVYTAADLNPLVHQTSLSGMPDAPFPPKYCLAQGDVRYVGDPIAIVIAENRYLAEDAVELIELDIEVQDPVIDVDA